MAVVLVVLLGVGWTLYAVGVFDPGYEGGGSATKPPNGAESEKPADYTFDKSFQEGCDDLDLSRFEDILPEQDHARTASTPAASEAAKGFDCSVSFTEGDKEDGSCKQCVDVAVEGAAFDDGAQAAKEWYEVLSEGLGVSDPDAEAYKGKVKEYEGEWDEGVYACADVTDTQPDGSEIGSGICHAYAVDGNLFLDIGIRVHTPQMPEQMEAKAMTGMLDDAIAGTRVAFTSA